MQEEYYCPKCGLLHRLVQHDVPETKVRCIQCGNRFAIKDASQQSFAADAGWACANCRHENRGLLSHCEACGTLRR